MPPPVTADCRDEREGTAAAPPGVNCARFVYTRAREGGGFEWNLVAILDNEGGLADRNEDCAFYAQANKHGDGSTWAAVSETCDLSFGAAYGPQVAHEADVWCNGADPYGWRIGFHAVVGDARRIRTGTPGGTWNEAGCAFLASHNGTDFSARWRDAFRGQHFWQSGLRLEGSDDPANPAHRGVWFSAGHFIVGFDFAGAAFQTPIRLGRGQQISLEGTDSVKLGLIEDRVTVSMNGKAVFAIDIHTGDVYVRGAVKPLA